MPPNRLELVHKIEACAYLTADMHTVLKVDLETGNISFLNWSIDLLCNLNLEVEKKTEEKQYFFGVHNMQSFEVVVFSDEARAAISQRVVHQSGKQIRRLLQISDNLLVIAVADETVVDGELQASAL